MILRNLCPDDVPGVKRIHEKFHGNDFDLPTRKNLLSEAVIEDGDEVIAYGSTKLMGEPTLILDLSQSTLKKTKAFTLLMNQAISEAKKAGLEYLVIATSNDEFAELLKKHYSLNEVKRHVLVLGL